MNALKWKKKRKKTSPMVDSTAKRCSWNWNESFVMYRESEKEILPYRALRWCSDFMCILVALVVIVVVIVTAAAAVAIAVEFSCMRRLWIHKATAKGKNITIFQFSFVLYLDKMKKKCVFLCRLWVNQCVAFLSKRVRKASNFIAECCWWFPRTVQFRWVRFWFEFGRKKKSFSWRKKKVCTVTSRVRTEYFYVVWVCVCVFHITSW